jgi:hypothetical protein
MLITREQSYFVWVSAERCYVVLDPLHCHALIKKTLITQDVFLS